MFFSRPGGRQDASEIGAVFNVSWLELDKFARLTPRCEKIRQNTSN
jgi:hypothetical protein